MTMKIVSTENILGYSVVCDGAGACCDSILSWVAEGDGFRWCACINPHSYVEALKSDQFCEALREADWVVPDGIGIVIASKFLGGKIETRVTGYDIFQGTMERLNKKKLGRVFFLGSTEEVLSKIKARSAKDFPNVKVVGSYSPPFKSRYSSEEKNNIISSINEANPDVLWVGMTAPKQEIWIYENARNLKTVKFAGAVGAVFDFYAETIKRPAPFFQRVGMEWVFRLSRQPYRMWKRTFISAPIYSYCVLREKIRRN